MPYVKVSKHFQPNAIGDRRVSDTRTADEKQDADHRRLQLAPAPGTGPAGIEQSTRRRKVAAVPFRPGAVQFTLLPPVPAFIRRGRRENPALAGLKSLCLDNQRPPDQSIVEFAFEPSVLRIGQPLPAANKRFVADVDNRVLCHRTARIRRQERDAVLAQRIDYGAQFLLTDLCQRDEIAKQLRPAVEVLTSVLEQYKKSGNRDAQASTLCALGSSYNAAGQRQKAIEEYQQALALYREIGDKTGEVKALSHLGDAYRGWGFPGMAVRFYREALQGYSQVDDRPGRAIALNNLGVTYLSLRDKKKSLEFLNLALAAYHEAGDSHGEALAFINIGAVDTMLAHDPEKALEMLQQAVSKLEPMNDRGNQADAFEMMGVVWSGLRKQELAEANFKRALGIYRELHDAKGEASVLKQMRSRGVGEDVAYGR